MLARLDSGTPTTGDVTRNRGIPIYRRYGLRESEAHARCESHLLGDGQVSLSVTHDTVIGKLGFGTSLTGVSNPVLVKQCRVRYRVGTP